ncbi:hypothetical protein FJZ36_00565 [Candidatus Poribacteria bacterium]|nr:hypothetical protein [Candidatus Poribacteria bacterium]
MAQVEARGGVIHVETDRYSARVATTGYVSGVMAGSFVDRQSGSRDPGFGLMIVDFLMEPGEDDDSTPSDMRYEWRNAYHGSLAKRYVETPQICTQAGSVGWETVRGDGFVAVHLSFTWTKARPPYRPGSRWHQWLVFPDGVRWFLAYDRVESVNTVDGLILRTDMPGHLKHTGGDTFRRIYLSYAGTIPASRFQSEFPPDARFLYQRGEATPDRFIRAYELANGTWLGGMALDPLTVYESWCHQRGYVCFIHELGGRRVAAGESFGAVHGIGYFDSIDEMNSAYDEHAGARALAVDADGWRLIR